MAFAYEHMPKVFMHATELAGLPLSATWNMVHGKMSFDQVVSEEATNATAMLGGSEVIKDFAYYTGDNAVDKAKYQLENPNSLMTPWGLTLDKAEVEMILMENPGIKELVNLPPELMAQDAKAAEEIINSGWFPNFVTGVKESSMGSGDDMVEVGKAGIDASIQTLGDVTRNTLASEAIRASVHESHPNYNNRVAEADPFGQYNLLSGAGANITNQGYDPSSAYSQGYRQPPGPAGTDDDDVTDPAHPEHDLHEISNMLSVSATTMTDKEVVEDILNELGTGGLTQEAVQYWRGKNDYKDTRPALDSALTLITELQYGDPTLVPSLADGTPNPDFVENDLFRKWSVVWLTPRGDEEPEINWDFMRNFTRSTQAEPPDPYTATTTTTTPTTTSTTATADTGDDDVEKLIRTTLAEEVVESAGSFYKAFYKAMNETPSSDHSAVQESMKELFYNAYTIFAVWNAPSGNLDLEDFEEFLSVSKGVSPTTPVHERRGYVWQPWAWKSGRQFQEQFDKVKEALRHESVDHLEAGTQYPGIISVFGLYDGSSAYRDRLAQLYTTGFDTGYTSSAIHSSHGITQAHWRDMGDEEWDIFDRMTKTPYEEKVAATPYGPNAVRGGLEDEDSGGIGSYIYPYSEAETANEWTRSLMNPVLTETTTGIYNPNIIPGAVDIAQQSVQGMNTAQQQKEESDLVNALMNPTLTQTSGLPPAPRYVSPGDMGMGVESYYDQFQPLDAVKQVPVEDWWAGSQEIDLTDPATRAAASSLQRVEGPTVEGLSREHLLSMPEPFDEEENKKRMAGRPYSTKLKVGGVIQKDEAGKPIRGTNFVPTSRWVPSV